MTVEKARVESLERALMDAERECVQLEAALRFLAQRTPKKVLGAMPWALYEPVAALIEEEK